MTKIRLFITNDLIENTTTILDNKQSHYLTNVMKQKEGDIIGFFNNKDGEFLGKITSLHKKNTEVEIFQKTKDFYIVPDIWILFAPVKKDNTDFIVQKSTELGARKIIPCITKHTISEKVRVERFRLQAIEASEQSRRVDVPEVEEAIKLEEILSKWEENRILYVMDETGSGNHIVEVFKENIGQKSAILIGPEGGFSSSEISLLKKQSFVRMISLGKRILRAETAVISALSCWQAICGDW